MLRRLCCLISCVALLVVALTGAAWAGGKQAIQGKAVAPAKATAGQAPLNPDFLTYQLGRGLDAPRTPDGQPLGERPAPAHVAIRSVAHAAGGLDQFPSSYDLRALGRVSSVKDQGSYGTCWSFASCGSLESSLMPESLDFSEDNMVLTSGFDTGATPLDKYDFGGNIWMSTAYLARWGGPVFESEDAYGDQVTPAGMVPRKHVQDILWFSPRPATVQDPSATENDMIKSAVSTYGACYISMCWEGSSQGSSYYNPSTAAYYYNGSSNTNHGVLVVGWDDNFPALSFATAPPGNGAFLIKNSWGSSWGQGGYFWVSYYDTKLGRTSPIAAFANGQSVNNYGDVYQYDPLGDVGEVNYSSGDPTIGWFANVFTARANISVTSVGFYTPSPNASYQVYIGSSLSTKMLKTSGSISAMGYHTISLPSPTTVSSGQPFAVAVKLQTPGYNYPLSVEYPYSGYSSFATAGPGQSYVSTNGTTWTDFTTLTLYDGIDETQTNVCLKAYTQYAPDSLITTARGVGSAWHRTPATISFSGQDTAGSGIAFTEYNLDGAGYLRAPSVIISGNAVHTLSYRSTDNAGHVEPEHTATVKIDSAGPVTSAVNNVSVKRGKKAKFSFRVSDVTPTAKVTIKIYRGSRVKKSISAGSTTTNVTRSVTWKCMLSKGRYTWKVFATDEAGNRSGRMRSNILRVK